MGKKRRNFSPEFKSKIALEAIKSYETISELSTKHDLHGNQISIWKRHLEENVSELFEVKRGRKTEEEAALIERLYGQIGKLQVELDWLKKNLSR